EANRVHHVVAHRAGSVRSVLRQSFPDGELRRNGILLKRWHVRRRRGRGSTDEILENPVPSNHRRGAGRVRGDGQNAAVPEQSASLTIIAQFDPAEAAAVNVRDAVVLGETFVEVRVIGIEQVEHATVFPKYTLDEQL